MSLKILVIGIFIVILVSLVYAAEPCTSQYLTQYMKGNCIYTNVITGQLPVSACYDIVDEETRADCLSHSSAIEPVKREATQTGQEVGAIAGTIKDTGGNVGLIIVVIIIIVIILYVVGKLKRLFSPPQSIVVNITNEKK